MFHADLTMFWQRKHWRKKLKKAEPKTPLEPLDPPPVRGKAESPSEPNTPAPTPTPPPTPTPLYPNDWTEISEYVREYQETDKHTFHKPGDRDCVAIDRNQWMDYDYFYIQLVQDPYVTPSDVSFQARIVLPATYSAGCSSFGSCDMHGGAGETTTPAEDPWFCVRPAPGKCANFNDGSYVVAIQAYLPMPPPPPPPTP